MADDVEILQQRVDKQRDKLGLAAGIVDLTQARLDTATAAYDEAERERKRLKDALRLARRRADRLAKEAKQAKKLARATKEDRDDADLELAEHVATRDKRQAKLVKVEAALAEAQALAEPPPPPPPAKKAATARKAPAKKTPAARKTPAKKTPAARETPAKKTAAKRAPAKKTAS
jgi:chromosome segregation ATPase